MAVKQLRKKLLLVKSIASYLIFKMAIEFNVKCLLVMLYLALASCKDDPANIPSEYKNQVKEDEGKSVLNVLFIDLYHEQANNNVVPFHNESVMRQNLIDSPYPWVVQYYSSWCSHCRRFVTTYQAAGRRAMGK